MSRLQQGSLLRLKRKAGPMYGYFVGTTRPTAAALIGNERSEPSFAIRISAMRNRQPTRFAIQSTPSFECPSASQNS